MSGCPSSGPGRSCRSLDVTSSPSGNSLWLWRLLRCQMGHLSQHSCLLWPVGVTELLQAVSRYLPYVSAGRGAAGWPRAPQGLVWPWPAGRGTISGSQAAMQPCLEQCLFLLNLEQLSDAALPPERTLFFCCCCVRTRGEYRLWGGTKRGKFHWVYSSGADFHSAVEEMMMMMMMLMLSCSCIVAV